jgi:predicted transcriptional regulator
LDGTERGAWGEGRKSGNTRLLESCLWVYTLDMSATEIIEQFKALPAAERAQVAKFVVENDDSWIPESFKQGMADAAAGRFAEMETVLSEAKPPSRAAE